MSKAREEQTYKAPSLSDKERAALRRLEKLIEQFIQEQVQLAALHRAKDPTNPAANFSLPQNKKEFEDYIKSIVDYHLVTAKLDTGEYVKDAVRQSTINNMVKTDWFEQKYRRMAIRFSALSLKDDTDVPKEKEVVATPTPDPGLETEANNNNNTATSSSSSSSSTETPKAGNPNDHPPSQVEGTHPKDIDEVSMVSSTIGMNPDPQETPTATTDIVGTNPLPSPVPSAVIDDDPTMPRKLKSTVSGGTPLAGYPYAHPVEQIRRHGLPERRRRTNEGAWTGAKRPRYPVIHRPFTNNTRAHIVGNRSAITRMHSLGYDQDIVRSHPVPPFLPPHAALGQRGAPEVVAGIHALQPGTHHWLFG